MEQQKTKEEFQKEISALSDIQNSKGKELADKKKAKAPQSEVEPLLEELKDVKEKLKQLTLAMQTAYPETKEPKKQPGGAKNEEKLKRAEEAKAAQGKGKKHQKGKKKLPGKEKKEAQIDTSDVTEAVLSAPFAGTRFRPNDPRALPTTGKRNVLITSALPYVNNVPHLGNIIGCVLSADVYARYCRLRAINTLFICGTDEYGTATETKAMAEKVTPQEICDKYSKIHDDIYKWFGISFDHFGRTTTSQQTVIAQDIFNRLNNNKFLVEQTVAQLYCSTCDRFLADRLVEGTCPKCGYDDARGDQCDKCQALINAVELVNPRCKQDGTTPVVRDSEHLFLDLPQLTDKLVSWIDESKVKGRWTPNGIAITNSWLSAGLQPRCITRDLKWGTPVPLDKYSGKVFYVWFDAPIGYLSITACYTEEWEKWWKNPSQVQLYQFMGKDNIPFHTVIFPSSLLGTGEDWTLLHHVSTTEYLNYENKDGEKVKFSKSRNIGVFGDGVQSTGIPPEVWRYYLLSCRPETSDTVFSWIDFAAKNNAELLANLGNFCNRCLVFLHDRLEGVVPKYGELSESDKTTISKVNEQLALYINALDEVKIKEGLRIAVIEIAALGNGYLQEQKAWELLKTDKERCGTVMALAANLAALLGAILEPYMPSFTEKLFKQLNIPHFLIPDTFSLDLVPAGHKIGVPLPIFRKLEDAELKQWREIFG